MATLNTPEGLKRQSPANRSTVRAAPKLRDSCHACSASKIKCNKEKPTCARCAKRGQVCEYLVTKRAGRKQNSRPSDTTTVNQTLPRSSWPASEPAPLPSPNFIQPSPRQHRSVDPDTLLNFLSPADPSSTTQTIMSTEFDDFFASPISFPVLDTSDSEMMSQSNLYPDDITNSLVGSSVASSLVRPEDAFLALDEAVSELPTISKSSSPPNGRAPTPSDMQSFQAFCSDLPCSCLIHALSLLKQLFPNASTACTRSRTQGFENDTCQLPTIESVVAENAQTIEAISNMLQCPCSQDSYLLAIMSLIVFKVLGWYAAAAREMPIMDDSKSPGKSQLDQPWHSSYHSEQVLQLPTVVGSYCIDGDDQGRMAAQLVLSELHRAQRLVNILSQRLKSYELRNGGVDAHNHSRSSSDGEGISPFSPTMLDQLGADLRKRLRGLSLEIVDTLRRG